MIQGASPVDAWQQGARHLLGNESGDFNLLISFPWAGTQDELPLTEYDPHRVLGADFDNSKDVANTIFPAKTWRNSTSRADFYLRYQAAHKRGKRKAWGTYFLRLVAFGDKRVNQLEKVIDALNSWKNTYAAAMVMHTSSSETDSLRPLGGPCLQYVQISCPNGSDIELTAVYRNHDFCNKVLGNYYGLSRLLGFIGEQTCRNPVRITALSVHAYFDTSKKKMKELAKID